jgi:hypothetical protein
MMLRDPDAAITPFFSMRRKIAGVVERAARVCVFSDADEIEYGQGSHGFSREKSSKG